MAFKIPVSVLVVIHTRALEVLLLERADHPGFWQSVTGSQSAGETLLQTACREVLEETGIDADNLPGALDDWEESVCYEIYPQWRWRYAPGVTQNTEHTFSLCLPDRVPVVLAPREHLHLRWLPWEEAARECFSSSNAQAIRNLPARSLRRQDPAGSDA